MSFTIDFTILKEREDLLNFLGIQEDTFEQILLFEPNSKQTQELSEDMENMGDIPPFWRHKIPKKNRRRGYRTVWEPLILKNEYKALARRLSSFLSYKLSQFPHHRTFGYVGGRNIRENAKDHCGHQNLISVDIKDFFPSISVSRITKFLESTGINLDISDLLSRFMTIGGTLPLGLPTSPIIANAICLPMDIELNELAQERGATFSRYADDISFSSDMALPSMAKITECLKRHSFEIAKSKTRTSKLGQAHYVTGLSISDPKQPHVPRQKKRRLRQEFYFAKKYGLDSHLHHLGANDHDAIQHEVNRLDGLVKFTAFHEPRLSAQLKTDWAEILQKSMYRPSFEPKNQARTPFYIYVDEAEYCHPKGMKILAVGMAVSQHQDIINQETQTLLNRELSDPFATGRREVINKRGLHFSEAHHDLRLKYIQCMQTLPFEGYVAMAKVPTPKDYEKTYIRLLKAMIRRRLMAAESKLAYLVFEENDKVQQKSIRKAVKSEYSKLESSNNRRPENYCIKFTSKPDLGMSIPDFLLGVLGGYLKSGTETDSNSSDRDKLLFERIRDKYKLILDVDSWTEYSRRNAIAPWQNKP